MARRIWNPTDIKTVVERYPEEGPGQLAALLDRSEDSVTGLARRFGLRSVHRRERQVRSRVARTLTVNAHFFDIMTADVAYVLGVIWAWGSIKISTRDALRLRCPLRGEPVLRTVLAMMGSQHILQRGQRRILVEIGNSLLVASLVSRYGKPPDSSNSDPPFPSINPKLVPDFARGLLAAAGEFQVNQLRWWASPRVIDSLGDQITQATGFRPTEIIRVGQRKAITWRGIVEAQAIRRWLLPAGVR
jgi:hypothetical protein